MTNIEKAQIKKMAEQNVKRDGWICPLYITTDGSRFSFRNLAVEHEFKWLMKDCER